MDIQQLSEILLPLLIAAKDGALGQASKVASQIGKAGVEKMYGIVKNYFTKDGPGAVKKLEELAQNPESVPAQNAVKGRLFNLLQENAVFLAEIRAIIGEINVDSSITQTSNSGDYSATVQIVGNNNTVR